MALPLLLAGPILRRVDPNLVSVWLALSEPAKVSLVGVRGHRHRGERNPVRHQRARGHVAARGQAAPRPRHRAHSRDRRARASSPTPSTPTTCRSSPAARPHDLASLNMLRDATAEESPDGHAHLALGYQPDVLPSFAPCPSKLPDLRILYGSCRLPSCRDPDALAYVDDYIADHVQDPRSRPHQLVLGGDQVYADDVDTLMMIGLIDLAVELIGAINPDDPAPRHAGRARLRRQRHAAHGRRRRRRHDRPGQGARRLRRGRQRRRSPTGACRSTPTPFRPDAGSSSPSAPASSPARTAPTTCISFGEFAALYLLVWSNACWTRRDPRRDVRPRRRPPSTPSTTRQPLKWTSKPTTKSRIDFPPLMFPELVSGAPLPAARPAGQAGQRGPPTRRRRTRPRPSRTPARPAQEPPAPRRLHRRPAQGAAGARQRPDLHDARRPRDHRRPLPVADLARPRAVDARSA